MRSAWRLIAALGFFLLSAAGLAADDLVAVPPLKARVTDLTGTLSRDQAARSAANWITGELFRLMKSRGMEIEALNVRPDQLAEK